MGHIVAEKGVPIPANMSTVPRNQYAAVLKSTKPGDSFSVYLSEDEKMGTVQSKIRQYANRNGIKISASEVSDIQLRVWVIANEQKKEGEV